MQSRFGSKRNRRCSLVLLGLSLFGLAGLADFRPARAAIYRWDNGARITHRNAAPRADLSQMDLSYADLAGTDLYAAEFQEFDLCLAHLMGAKLVGANFSSATLAGADLTDAHVGGANLSATTPGGYSPGGSPAIVAHESIMLEATNVLTMEVGRLAPGGEHDQLIVTGSALLDGTLDVIGELTMEDSSIYEWQLGALISDSVTIDGDLSLDDGWTLQLTDGRRHWTWGGSPGIVIASAFVPAVSCPTMEDRHPCLLSLPKRSLNLLPICSPPGA